VGKRTLKRGDRKGEGSALTKRTGDKKKKMTRVEVK